MITDRRPVIASLVAAAGALLLAVLSDLSAVRPLVYTLTGLKLANTFPLAQFAIAYVVVGLGVALTGYHAQTVRHAVAIVAVALAGVATVGVLVVGTDVRPLVLQFTGGAPVAVAYLVGVGRTSLERVAAALGTVTPLALYYVLTAPGPANAVPGPAFVTAFLAAMNVVAALPVVYLGWRTGGLRQ